MARYQGNAQPALFPVVHPIIHEIEAMAVVKSPGGDLERYAVLSAVRVRFGLIPFEDRRLFPVGMVWQCRM